jgi:hypothetical protein
MTNDALPEHEIDPSQVPLFSLALERVAALTDEVKQLHPLLDDLFRRLPDIQHVHYTHGNHEMGADFVLEKFDKTLAEIEYIGVIAKTDPIRQDHADVVRQIDECSVPRLLPGGKRIHITQIWVITTQGISHNAREKIENKYGSSNVRFIDQSKLAKLVDEHLPPIFTTLSPKVQAYLSEVASRLAVESERSLIGLNDPQFFVEPDLTLVDFDSYGKKKIRQKNSITLDGLIGDGVHLPCVLIEAPMGGGKSRLAREMTRRLLDLEAFKSGRLFPVLMSAKIFYGDFAADVAQVVSDVRSKYGIADDCRIVIIMDGFDELDVDADERLEILTNALSNCGASPKKPALILLSRPLDETGEVAARLRSIDTYRIDQFRGNKGLQLLAKAAGGIDLSNRIIADVKDSRLFVALEGAPIAYLLLGRLLGENDQDLPSNLTELFQKYVELVLGRWEISKGLRRQVEYETLVEALTRLAVYLIDNKLEETSLGHFAEMIHEYVAPRRLDVNVDVLLRQVTTRDSLLYIRSTSGTIGFRHRAFSEFFRARALVHDGEVMATMRVLDSQWVTCFFFAVGILKDCPDVIRGLADLRLEAENHRVARALFLGQFLLAGYLTPRDAAKHAIRQAFVDMAQLYVESLDPNSNYKLRVFPPLQLLGVLNVLMRRQYGYKHFEFDLGEIILELEGEGNTATNAVALFFLDTAYKRAGGELKFDRLLEKFGDALPLPVKFGIRHEVERFKLTSDLIRHMERNLKRQLLAAAGRDGSAPDIVDRLYKIPLANQDKPLLPRD